MTDYYALPYLVVDIETTAGRPDDLLAEFHRTWRPDDRWKPETKGQRYDEAWTAFRGRAALALTAEICAVAVKHKLVCAVFHTCGEGLELDQKQHEWGHEFYAPTVHGLLQLLTEWLHNFNVDYETQLVAHNAAFDLPRLRTHYVREGMTLPFVLRHAAADPICLMRRACKMFCQDKERFVSLADICDQLLIPHHKGVAGGEDVAGMVERGDAQALVQYAALDVALEERLYLITEGMP